MNNRLQFLRLMLAHTSKTVDKVNSETKQLMVEQAERLKQEIELLEKELGNVKNKPKAKRSKRKTSGRKAPRKSQ